MGNELRVINYEAVKEFANRVSADVDELDALIKEAITACKNASEDVGGNWSLIETAGAVMNRVGTTTAGMVELVADLKRGLQEYSDRMEAADSDADITNTFDF